MPGNHDPRDAAMAELALGRLRAGVDRLEAAVRRDANPDLRCLLGEALRLAGDDADQVRHWMSQGEIGKVSDGQARDWVECDAVLWAVVVKPWVLVQELELRSGTGDRL